MASFSSLSNTIGKLISTKPFLITSDELALVGNQIKLVGVDALKGLVSTEEKPFSPRLLNWVEPYLIKGFTKTLFYTEVNSGLKVGDRVFIINGNYDNDLLIKANKYKKGRDGYKILYIDNCQVVLDINYTGDLPWIDEDLDNFIKVYNIKTVEDFLHANRQITTRGGNFDYKFNYYQNNIIYTEENFDPISDWGKNAGLSGGPGFFVRDGINGWTNITSAFMSGTFSYALSTTYTNNNRVKIINDTFTFSGFEFKEDFIYEWGIGPEPDAQPGTQSQWIVDVRYNNPILTKGNFRDGNFKGDWNTGVYGRQDKKIKWEGEGDWNNGTMLNVLWEDGTIDSKYTLPESYLSEFDENGIPYQKVNGPDNNGKGFNYIIDSEIEKSVINNGTIINTELGLDASTYSIVENFILSTTQIFNNIINKAFFEKCEFKNAYVRNSEIKNSKSENTKFNNIKSINSHYKNSIIKDSNYLSDEIIKILDYDEFNISEFIGATTSSSRPVSHKVYKFYVSKSSFDRLKLKDSFYIKGIKINNNTKDVIKFFDRKFRVGSWSEYIDDFVDDTIPASLIPKMVPIVQPNIVATYSFYKRGIEYSAFLSTPGDNEWRHTSIVGGYTGLVDPNPKKGYSIDIVTSISDIHSPSTEVYGIDFNRSHPSPTASVIMPPSLGNNIDFTKAYIIDSDFDSGLFETSNWNSGRHINYNNDSNITIPSIEGGYYDLSIATMSSVLTAITNYNFEYPESSEDYLKEGDVVFLNGVDYDTSGKILSITISASGSGYTQSATGVSTINGSGTGFTLDYTADTIGSVLSIGSLVPGSGYADNNYFGVSTVGGAGIGFTLDYTVSGSVVISATISNQGTGYLIGDVLDIPGGSPSASVTVTSITNGEVLSATISTSGIGYTVGDLITINDGNINAKVQVISTTGSVIRLPDTYKVLSNISGVIELEEVVTGTYSILSTLLDDGLFYTTDAYNRYGYIYKTKFNKSKIKAGLFRRSYMTESFIENDSFDVEDKDFNNIEKIRSLVISDPLFTNNNNILSKALYMNGSIVNGSDIWNDGLGQFLIWNGGTFNKGTIKKSRWIDGVFRTGTFYDSRSFDANSTVNTPNYYTENIRSYYKDGLTTLTTYNDRYTWQNGEFNNGEFYKSDWEDGVFNNGKIYYSKWYDGIFNNGTIGDIVVSVSDTLFYNGVINYATVENATLYALDTSYSGLSNSTIYWNDGVFNGGVFGSDIIQTTASNTAIWYTGMFNGGQFITNARWKNGTFNGGKFISGYGWTVSGSTTQTDYGWEDGVFNGGEFGNANLGTNSVWYTGEFNGGKFTGRYWNSGVFTSGQFEGSSTYSAVGGYKVDAMTVSNAYNFVQSYTQSYYGMWNDGYVTNVKDKFIKDKKLYTDIERSVTRIKEKITTVKNALWIAGTFSHPSGEFNNSVWLNGGFETGKFNSSSFNPYVIRNGGLSASFNVNDNLSTGSGSCVWYNGILSDSDFYISRWNQGKWLTGTAFGMVWKNGISNYMNAYNVFWENGTWRNGNWQGSYYQFDGSVLNDFNKQMLFRGMSWSGTSSCHIWNIFKYENTVDSDRIIFATGSTPTSRILPSAPALPSF